MTNAIIFHVIDIDVSDLNKSDKELKVEISSDYELQIVCE